MIRLTPAHTSICSYKCENTQLGQNKTTECKNGHLLVFYTNKFIGLSHYYYYNYYHYYYYYNDKDTQMSVVVNNNIQALCTMLTSEQRNGTIV